MAIILDGNGRWAEKKGKKRSWGHYKGAQNLHRIIGACPDHGIGYLTVFAFSTENWKRPQEEVDYLMELLESYFRKETDKLHATNVRVRVLGDRSRLDTRLLHAMDEAEAQTCHNTGLQLQLAINYGGRQEITAAVQKVMHKVQEGTLQPEALTEEYFSTFLQTHPYPDPDILIRTGGELRLSNYLLWQICHTELVFFPVYWPDFTVEHLQEALATYRRRVRTYGGLRAAQL